MLFRSKQKATEPIWDLKHDVLNKFKHVDNVVEVHWERASDGGFLKIQFYDHVVENVVPKVAVDVFKLLEFLKTRGCRSRNIGMIGHSLGAHIAGMAGRIFKQVCKSSVNIIIGENMKK